MMGVSKAGGKKEQDVYPDLDVAGCYKAVRVLVVPVWTVAVAVRVLFVARLYFM